ncbi:DUF3800 domain-containing protein [Amedibacillus sp. YH-ame10]
MILYVDETECDDYFIVAGILTDSKDKTDKIYKQFKKKVKNIPLSKREKEKIFIEFKSVYLDNKYQKIKILMLKQINQLNYKIIFSMYNKNGNRMNQETKEKQYILLLDNIVSKTSKGIDIIFDSFNKNNFEQKIIDTIKLRKHVISIKKQDSRLEAGIQFIDKICSVIRMYKTNVENDFYKFIADNILEV